MFDQGVLFMGFCLGGFVQGVLSRGFCPGGFVQGVLSGSFVRGLLSGGYVRGGGGGFVWGVFVLESILLLANFGTSFLNEVEFLSFNDSARVSTPCISLLARHNLKAYLNWSRLTRISLGFHHFLTYQHLSKLNNIARLCHANHLSVC